MRGQRCRSVLGRELDRPSSRLFRVIRRSSTGPLTETHVEHGAQPGPERQLFSGRHRSQCFEGELPSVYLHIRISGEIFPDHVHV